MNDKQRAHWERELELWTSKVAEYNDKLRHAKKKRDEAQAQFAPFHVGQEVEYHKRDGWVPAIVRAVEPNTWGCDFQVSLRKKDGSWAERTERALGARHLRPSGFGGAA